MNNNEEGKRIIISNSLNDKDANLKNFPNGARDEVLSGVNMKMYDFMRTCNSDFDTINAIDYLGKKYTYDDVFIQIERYAKAFKAYGIQKGDFVSVMLPNSPEIIYVKFALNRVGAVANLIDPRNNPNTILNYVNNANSKMLITILDKYKSTIEPIIDELKVNDIFSISPMESITLEDLKLTDGYFNKIKQGTGYFLYEYKKILLDVREQIRNSGKYRDISELLKWEKQHTGSLDTEYVPFDPATVLYTSGTTGGSMKGAVAANEAYNSIYKNLQYGVKNQKPGEKFCGIIPYFTSYGSGAGMFNCMCNRMEQYLYPNFNPKDFVKIIEKDKPNAIIAVPKFYEMLINSKKDYSYFEHIVIGGDKVLPNTYQKFVDFFNGKQIIIGYGATEFLGVLSVTLDNSRLDSSGVPLPSAKVKIVNPETLEELPFFEEGEAYISNVSMMLDYLNKHDEVEKITAYDEDNNKYYGTGDKMYMTPDGQICFVDRYKRLMKRPDGHQVDANSIETMISEIDGIKECCVVGLKYKDSSGVIPTAFVVPSDDTIDKQELINKMEEASILKLASYREKALAYAFIEKIPMTNMGKVDAFKLSNIKLEDLINAIIVDRTFIDKKEESKVK